MRRGFRFVTAPAFLTMAVILSGCTSIYYDSPSTTVVLPAPPPPPPRWPHPHPVPGPGPIYQTPSFTPQETAAPAKTKTPRTGVTPMEIKDRPAGRDRKSVRTPVQTPVRTPVREPVREPVRKPVREPVRKR